MTCTSEFTGWEIARSLSITSDGEAAKQTVFYCEDTGCGIQGQQLQSPLRRARSYAALGRLRPGTSACARRRSSQFIERIHVMASKGQQPHRIVIVGGGVAGLEIVSTLGRRGRRPRGKSQEVPTITFIDRDSAHVWKPTLHTIAAGTVENHRSKIPEPTGPPIRQNAENSTAISAAWSLTNSSRLQLKAQKKHTFWLST